MYKDYSYVFADHFARFGGHQGNADYAGAFSLRVNDSSTFASVTIGCRLIMFGD